ncbi:MAG TPA: TRAP transporter large permease [Dehalococcoidia bacterium]|nr:TRAP transporter large permease [Dehalococcoidia bacterium]
MPSPEVIGILGFIAMFVMLAFGIHIGITLGVIGFIGCGVMLGFSRSLSLLVTTPYYVVADYNFIVLPMFILMGELAFQGGIGILLYQAASKWLGRLHGGLAMATTAASAALGAITGSSLAAAATFGKMAIPEMRRHNYSEKLSAGVVAASGTLAVMIPPSGIMVLYTILAPVSLGKLMIAGIIPGFISAAIYMVMIYTRVRLNPQLGPKSTEVVSWGERFSSIRWLIPVAVVMIVMLGGIYLGIFSPIEAGSVGAFTVFIVVLARRSASPSMMITSLANTARAASMIGLVIVGAMVFGRFLMLTELPSELSNFVSSLTIPPVGVLAVILLIYIVLGCIMDVPAMIVITVPIFYPVLHDLGLPDIWVAILIIKIVEIAAITPPIGLNVYVLKGVVGDVVTVGDIFRGIIPFFVMDVLTLALLVWVPQIALWLPSTMFQ